MFACIISRYGPPDALEVHKVPVPTPGPMEILVRVRASAINRADLLQRMGKYAAPSGAPKDIPGLEFAGEVAGLGAGATNWQVGDRVFGIIGGGAHAEYLVTHEATVARVPDALGWREAAAIPEAFITAYDALVTQAELQAGERVLIHAVGSGVGLAAVQVARARGAIPYGTSRTADKLERSREYGLEDGIALRDDLSPLGTSVSAWTGGRGIEVVLDLVGGPYVAANIDAAALKGRIMLVGTVAGGQATLEVGRILGKRLTLQGTVLRSRSVGEKIVVTTAFDREVVPLVASGVLRPTIDSVFGLAQIVDAHRRVESNATFGKVVVEM